MEIESASHYLLLLAARVSVSRWNEFRDFFFLKQKASLLAYKIILNSFCAFIPSGFCKPEPSAGPQCDWFVCRCRLSCCWSLAGSSHSSSPPQTHHHSPACRAAGRQGRSLPGCSDPPLFLSFCFYILKLVFCCQLKPLIIFNHSQAIMGSLGLNSTVVRWLCLRTKKHLITLQIQGICTFRKKIIKAVLIADIVSNS